MAANFNQIKVTRTTYIRGVANINQWMTGKPLQTKKRSAGLIKRTKKKLIKSSTSLRCQKLRQATIRRRNLIPKDPIRLAKNLMNKTIKCDDPTVHLRA
jgi:hypothetical protein